MIYANLQSNLNSTINLLLISIWPGRKIGQNPLWGKEVGCKGWSLSWGLNSQSSRVKDVVCKVDRGGFCQVSARQGYLTVEGCRLDWNICSVYAKTMTCFRLTEPLFALGLSCKAGVKINQCRGTSWDLLLPLPVNGADKLVTQSWPDCVGCQCQFVFLWCSYMWTWI